MSGFQKSAFPDSVAIIMDGNGRWAQKRSLQRTDGHIAGAEAVYPVLKALFENGAHYVTLYAFSTENRKRPRAEVDGIMKLVYRYLLDVAIPEIKSNSRVGVRFLGDLSFLSPEMRDACEYAERISGGRPYLCSVALNYGGRSEILRAVNLALKDGRGELDESSFSRYLYTKDTPDPDLIIRTGGEFRISNFLLWQSAYSEYVILDKLWPDITPDDILLAIDEYAKRHRRFGAV